jgi:hypothetical protein
VLALESLFATISPNRHPIGGNAFPYPSPYSDTVVDAYNSPLSGHTRSNANVVVVESYCPLAIVAIDAAHASAPSAALARAPIQPFTRSHRILRLERSRASFPLISPSLASTRAVSMNERAR